MTTAVSTQTRLGFAPRYGTIGFGRQHVSNDVVRAKDCWRHLESFRAYNESRDLSPTTLQNYDYILHRFLRWLIDNHGRRAEITPRRVREFAAQRLARGNSALTARTYLTALRAFFSYLVVDEVIHRDKNPMRLVPNPRIPSSEILPLTNEEIQRLLDCFDRDNPAQDRDFTMCLLMLDTGLRVSEVAALKVENINFFKCEIKVMGKGRKARSVYIGQRMCAILLDYVRNRLSRIGNGRASLFPPTTRSQYDTMRPHYISEIIRKKMDQAGIERANSSGHRLRHTFAYNAAKAGMNLFALQTLLGHSKLEMTKRYVRLAEDDVAEAHRRASPVDRMAI